MYLALNTSADTYIGADLGSLFKVAWDSRAENYAKVHSRLESTWPTICVSDRVRMSKFTSITSKENTELLTLIYII